MWLNNRTEMSFRAVYGHLDQVAARNFELGEFAGIADDNNTFGHVRWKKICAEYGIKPIYGVRLAVADLEVRERRYPFSIMTFIAMNTKGLQEIYNLVDIAHQQFYWRPRITYKQLNKTSKNITILSGVAPELKKIKRKIYLELSPNLPLAMRNIKGIPAIAAIDNWYPFEDDKIIYEPLADDRKLERKTTPQHILTEEEWLQIFPGREDALETMTKIGRKANVELAEAPMVKYPDKADIHEICIRGAKRKNIDLKNKVYKARYKREMDLIESKGYVDYFLVVADLIHYAKTKMLVGHGRGSSAGSLICYLMDITEIDPIPYKLFFERFIDINRFDLPDIDIDFQDNKRHLVVKYLQRKYGVDCVAQIGNVSRLKPKSAIGRFAKALNVPLGDVEELKDAILERSGGDARSAQCMLDTFHDTDVGKNFITQYPNMKVVAAAESHASHAGVHAAGILVCNSPITNYCGINSRDGKRVGMIDKKDAEAINLLKIDALGLRTLSILAEVCDQIEKPYEWLYTLPLDNNKAFKVLNEGRLTGIFQFEGNAIRSLAKQMPIENMDDIFALSALGRPGPLATGGASDFTNARSGKSKTKFLNKSKLIRKLTKDTFGIVIYQEQMLSIGREYGKLSWADVGDLRKAASKSLGDEFFGKYKDKFVKGAMSHGETKEDAIAAWNGISTSGSWTFNKSHSVSYGMITYLCAYLKGNYPLEFAVASLNHTKDDNSAIKLLRDLDQNEKIKYKPISKKYSKARWTVRKGKLIGGFLTLNGIGPANANKIIKCREEGTTIPAGIRKKLDLADTPFRNLYPAREIYGKYYDKPGHYGVDGEVSEIINVEGDGHWVFIGKLIKKDLRDANELVLVSKRGGKYAKGPTAYLNFYIEDDTDNVLCTINRFDYEAMGKDITEAGKVDKDWYMIYGIMRNGWRKVDVKNIQKITK